MINLIIYIDQIASDENLINGDQTKESLEEEDHANEIQNKTIESVNEPSEVDPEQNKYIISSFKKE